MKRNLVCSSEWNADNNSNIGSDRFPIHCTVNLTFSAQERYMLKKWCFEKADWGKFQENCKASLISMDSNIEEYASKLILNAALKSIPMSSITGKRKMVPWWNEECTKVVKERNKALRVLRNNLKHENLIDYQRKKALSRKVIKSSGTIGREEKLGVVWNMVKKMSGKRKFIKMPVLEDGETITITDKKKANLLCKSFANIHNGHHLDELHKKRKEEILSGNQNITWKKDDVESTLCAEITMRE